MRCLPLLPLALVGVLGLLGASSALAAEPNPKERIEAVYAEITLATQEAEDQEALTARLTVILDGLMDYPAFAQRTLRASWPELSREQREIFIDRFKRLVVKIYGKRFRPRTEFAVSYRNDGLRYRNEARTAARVDTTIRGRRVAADVDYYFVKGGGSNSERWFVFDFEIDSVSMALNWRRQFERIIAQDGFDALIERIEERVKDDDGDEDDD